jgi:hypothetical protein
MGLNFKELSNEERRESKRLMMKDGAYSVFSTPAGEKLGSLHDLSKRGLSFVYPDNSAATRESGELEIFSEDLKIKIVRLPYRNVNDFECVKLYPFEWRKIRRRGVEFGELTSEQLLQIELIIKNHQASGAGSDS